MKFEILDEQGEVENIIIATMEFVEEHYAGRWREVEEAPVPTPTPAIPERVTRRKALQALLLAGLLDDVQPAIDAIPDETQRRMAQIEWDDSLEFERQRPLVIAIGAAIGLDAAGLDALFIRAEAL